jgi:ATP-dependent protease ClpP protease subunit
MKKLAILFLSFLLSLPVQAAHITGRTINYNLNTHKVISIVGVIDDSMEVSVKVQQLATYDLPGPRLVLIYSPGGSTIAGDHIIERLEKEKRATRQPLVCMVIGAAHSMAFNILSHCDVRLMTFDSTSVVHKVAIGGDIGMRPTARNLRRIAKEMDIYDEPYRIYNAAKMHISVQDYDKYADAETEWSAPRLLRMGYLTGIATFD